MREIKIIIQKKNGKEINVNVPVKEELCCLNCFAAMEEEIDIWVEENIKDVSDWRYFENINEIIPLK